MPKRRSWTDEQLIVAVGQSKIYRAVLLCLGLIPAGGNYSQVRNAVARLGIGTEHFTGQAWNKGKTYHSLSRPVLESLLVAGGLTQSHKLKKRLYEAGIKSPKCELCGWAERSVDGRVPVELDHVNGDHSDNRLENLRILCPNCHSLQPTHRGKNKGVALRRARVLE